MDEKNLIAELSRKNGTLSEALNAAYVIINELRSERDELKKQISGFEIYKAENSRIIAQMSADNNKTQAKLKKLEKENHDLRETLKLTAEKEKLKTKEQFGRSSEKIEDLLGELVPSEIVDEDHKETETSYSDSEKTVSNILHHKCRKRGKKQSGKRKIDLSRLPEVPCFQIDIDELNEKYGEFNWVISNWHVSSRIEYPKNTAFVLKTYTPVISVGLEHRMISLPSRNELYPGSIASPSLAAEIIYQKFFLFVPLYRIERAFQNIGINISRQTMCNWVNNFAFMYFWSVYNYLIECLMDVNYHQCDETPYQVIMDGRPAGAKSFMWLHTGSELCSANPIIIFCYELTRGTDHLRKFYDDFKGYITCDAYCSYHVLQKENEEIIIVCGCMMHCRRRWADSLSLIDKKDMTDDQIKNLTEVQALLLISEIYKADEALKALSAEERRSCRETIVRPLVEKYFAFIEKLDVDDDSMSNRCRDAVKYSRNQKEYLMRFLNDGNVPIDNGFAERCIKSVALLRKASLFSYSTDGAEASAIMHSIVETAKANGANVYLYIRYILETMPSKLDGTDRSFLSDMLPWSDAYKIYEEEHRFKVESPYDRGGYAEKPKTPRKNDRKVTA